MSMIQGAMAVMAVGAGFWALGKFVPGLVVKRLHEGFEALKDSAWIKDAAHPKRAQALVAVLACLEDELPAPGEHQEVYDELGAAIAAHAHVGAFQLGSAAQWAKVARDFGDAVDLELAADVKELAANAPPPASAA